MSDLGSKYAPEEIPCPKCGGPGEISSDRCTECYGDGFALDYEFAWEAAYNKLEEIKEKYPELFI